MIIVEKKPVPIYELKCFECGSRIQYKREDVHTGYIKCPVCGMGNAAFPTFPVNYELSPGHGDWFGLPAERKAHWSDISGQACICSGCGKPQNYKQARGWLYCPHCGRMMEEV